MNKERSDYMFGPPEIERPPSMKWCLRAHIHIALRERVNARILKWRDSFIAPVTIAHISDSGRRYYVSIRKEYRGYDWEVVKYDSGGEVIERQPPWSFSRTKELAIKDFMGSGWWNAKVGDLSGTRGRMNTPFNTTGPRNQTQTQIHSHHPHAPNLEKSVGDRPSSVHGRNGDDPPNQDNR